MGSGAADWKNVVCSPEARVRSTDQAALLEFLKQCGPLGKAVKKPAASILKNAPFQRILELCPCLYSQLDVKVSAKGVVHLCEITLNSAIDSSNVYEAFEIQHPDITLKPFRYAPIRSGAGGGDIMEAFCVEVLSNHGVSPMPLDSSGWPLWSNFTHLSLNAGKMNALKLYGDILIPAAPHNILISVKSEAARERFIVSGNRLESVGFGFFKDASEFWTENRMKLLKRWGFSAVYMPPNTLQEIMTKLEKESRISQAVNINGRPLYRRLNDFGADIVRVVGKLSFDL
jgi:hypothetical protein